MKKIIKLMSLLVLFLILPTMVNADMGSPEMSQFKVRVSNPNGIDVVVGEDDSTKHYDYDSVFKAVYEYKKDGVDYFDVLDENTNNYYSVKSTDLEVVSKDFNYKDMYKNDEELSLYVIGDDCYLYNGPSEIYGKKDNIKIPKGTTLKYMYSDDCWAYVSYNGKTGYVFKYTYENEIMKSNVANVTEASAIVTKYNVDIYDSPLTLNKTGKTLNINDLIEIKYTYMTYGHEGYVYVEKEKGWIKLDQLNNNFAYKEDCMTLFVNSSNGINLYEKSTQNSKVLTQIPANTELNVLYSDQPAYSNMGFDLFSYYYVTYNNVSGWIVINADNEEIFTSYEKYQITFADGMRFFEQPNLKNVIFTASPFSAGDIIESYYMKYAEGDFNFYYVKKDDFTGWLKISKDIEIESQQVCSRVKDTVISNDENNTESTENENNKNTSKDSKFKLTPNEIIYCSIGGALVLAVTALVTIILIKKEKNKKLKKEQEEIIEQNKMYEQNQLFAQNQNIVQNQNIDQNQSLNQNDDNVEVLSIDNTENTTNNDNQ